MASRPANAYDSVNNHRQFRKTIKYMNLNVIASVLSRNMDEFAHRR
jgi:hypothetical protein